MAQHTSKLEDLLTFALQSAALALHDEWGENVELIWFTEEPRTLHRTVRQIRDRYHKDLPALADLTFDPEGAFPYSPELRQILGNLQLDGVIRRRNPSFDRFQPQVFPDTGDVLKEEVATLLKNDQQRKAFAAVVEELKKLAIQSRE